MLKDLLPLYDIHTYVCISFQDAKAMLVMFIFSKKVTFEKITQFCGMKKSKKN